MPNPNRRRWTLLSGALVLLLTVLACSIPGQGQEPTPAAPTQTAADTLPAATATPLPPTPTAAPTSAPTDTPVPPEPTAAPDVSFQGVSFSFDKSIASSAWGEVIAANPPTEDGPGFGIYPQHIQFSFKNYTLQNTFHDPRIFIYPVKEYAAMSEPAGETIGDLAVFLQQAPQTASSIPFLPDWNAAQVMRSNIRYLSFQNGKGVRFLSYYAQSYALINNNGLFYTYQGLTDDENYYVSIILPVANPMLPADGQVPSDDYDALAAKYDTYIQDTEQKLSSQPDESFTPNLALLDAMFKTLVIE